jgi:hypothetical protein
MTNQTLLECPFDGCEDELQNRNGMAGCPTHTIMLNHADWNFRRAAAPAGGGDLVSLEAATNYALIGMNEAKARAAAAEERAGRVEAECKRLVAAHNDMVGAYTADKNKSSATVAALVEAGKAFVEAWDKSHQLEKTDVALRMMRTALAAVKGE